MILSDESLSNLGFTFSAHAFVNQVHSIGRDRTVFRRYGSSYADVGGERFFLIEMFIFSIYACRLAFHTMRFVTPIRQQAMGVDINTVFIDPACNAGSETEHYQLFLSFSVLNSIGSSLLLYPSMSCVAHCSIERHGLVSGTPFIGGGFGVNLFPLMIQLPSPQVGWGGVIHVLEVRSPAPCMISLAFCSTRFHRREEQTRPSEI